MNCRIARRLVVGTDDARLSVSERTALRAHLQSCGRCARLERREQLVSQWLDDLPTAEPPAHFEWRLRLRLSQLEREIPAMPPAAAAAGRRRWVLPFAFSTAAAAVVVVAVGLGLGMRRDAGRMRPAASVRIASHADPATWTPGPRGPGGVTWPRLVPVRSGAPLGPEVRADATPSILGEAPADTSLKQHHRADPIEVRPVRW